MAFAQLLSRPPLHAARPAPVRARAAALCAREALTSQRRVRRGAPSPGPAAWWPPPDATTTASSRRSPPARRRSPTSAPTAGAPPIRRARRGSAPRLTRATRRSYIYADPRPFEKLPASYKCPSCKAPKASFVEKDVSAFNAVLPALGVLAALAAAAAYAVQQL
jgi:hypothetical protein